jgi:hypothetical protein
MTVIAFSQDSPRMISRQEDTSSMKKALDNAQHFLDSMKNVQVNSDVLQGMENLVRY